MKRLRRFVKRLTSWAKTEGDEERLRAEIEEHIALQTEDNLRAGMSPDEARRQAVLKFGAVEAIKEEYRDRRGLPLVESLWQDVRYAVRRLRNSPAFTLTAILTLALGIGVTTAMFTLAHAVLMKSLDRKSTRLNSSHPSISYAVFCLKKKKTKKTKLNVQYTPEQHASLRIRPYASNRHDASVLGPRTDVSAPRCETNIGAQRPTSLAH